MQRPGVAADLASVGVKGPFSVASLFVAQGEALKAWAGAAPLQTDDRSALEFSGPRSIFGSHRDDNAASLRALAASSPKPAAIEAAYAAATAKDWRDRGLMMLKADGIQPAYDNLSYALDLNPNDPEALDGLLKAAVSLNTMIAAETRLKQLATDPSHSAARLALSRLMASQGNFDGAARIPTEILQANPDDVPALEQLASILSDVGDAERLDPVVQRLIKAAPKNTWSHYYAASYFFLQNRHETALQAARNSVMLDPANAKAHNLLGACLASLGQNDAARAAFQASLKADPKEPGTYANLGTLELQTGNRALAAKYFGEALTIDPSSQAAREGLNSIR
jgi:tetratricopeptide (TPR) repeat protein